jgi:hypothetical protein
MVSEPIIRECRECGQAFEIGLEEQALLRELAAANQWAGWTLPRRCTPCRAARRRERLVVRADQPDEWRRCVDCGVEFEFGGRDKTYFAARAWAPPTRCRDCRRRAPR